MCVHASWIFVNIHVFVFVLAFHTQEIISQNREMRKERSGFITPFLSSSALVQFSSVAQLCPTLCSPMDHSTPGFPVHHQLPELAQTHVHWVGNAIHPSHPLSPPSPPAFNLSQHQGLFQWVSSSNQVAKVLPLQPQLQHQCPLLGIQTCIVLYVQSWFFIWGVIKIWALM